MATKTEEFLTGTGTTIGFTTQYINESDIKVRVNGGDPLTFIGTTGTPGTDEYKIAANSTTITFGDNQNGKSLHIYSETDVTSPTVTFTPGSSIKAADLNALETLVRHGIQESRNDIIEQDLRDGQVTSAKILDGTIVDADINASAAIANTKIADGLLKSTITVNSANIVDGSIVDADVSNSANINGSKLANDSVALTKLGGGNLPSDIVVTTTNIENNTIVDADVNTSAAIAGTKINPNFGSQNIVTSGTSTTGNITVGGNVTVSGTVDGRDVALDGSKLDTIESGATADQTNEEIRDAVEAASNSNTFTDADHTKLNGIETAATQDQTAAEIKTLFRANNSDKITDSEIATGTLDNRYYTEAELNGGQLNTLYFTEAEITGGAADGRYYTETELDAGQLDNRYFTETELTGGALDGRYYTETEAEARFLRQDSSETIASGVSWSNSDSFVATTAAINARIIDLIDEVGGFTAIANETSFPTTNPQGATGQSAILSIQAASTTLTPSGTTVTIANGAGSGNTVTITGVPTAIPQNFGFLVESTSTTHTYAFHRLVPIATQVNTVASNITNIAAAGANVVDINNFADLYQISNNAPTQRADGNALQDGDLWFDNSNDNLRVYDGTNWAIITPAQSVLDDIAIVSGAVTYSEDLGLITDAVSTGSSNGSLDIVADALEDEKTFTVTVSSGAFLIDGVSKPTLTLHKGWTYTFDVSDSSNGSHPLRFYAGSSQYSTNVTVTGTQGQAGAKVQIVIPESQPTNFQYYCTNHSGMGNTITVVEDPIKAVADIASSVVTVGGIAGNVTTVATNISNVNAAVTNQTNINAAVNNATNINAAVSNAANITAVANNETNINAVKNNSTNINAAVSNASNINSAVSNATNINSVVSNASNINTVAGAISNVNSVGNNISNVNSVHSNATNINSAVSNATNINTVSSSIADVNRYANEYKISSSAPGSPSAGDLWFDTANATLKNYNGAAWLGITSNSGIQNVSDDTSPELAAALDCNNFNLTEVATISGNNLQLDFGTI